MDKDNDRHLPENMQAPDVRELRSGVLNILYERGFLRSICLGETEIIRMIYFALRDHNWKTIDLQIKNEDILEEKDRFTISYEAHHFSKEDRIITWHVRIEGRPDSSVVFSLEGTFERPFLRNRAGICVLHPIREVSDEPCEVTHPDGSTTIGNFPVRISPHQPFKDIRKLEWTTVNGIVARLDFYGDIFEMEDQRNWTDASFKTYCTPLALPFPVQMNSGDTIRQKVELKIESGKEFQRKDGAGVSDEVRLIPDPDHMSAWPQIGSCIPLEDIPLDDLLFKRIAVSGLDHLRADILLSDPNWAGRMEYCIKFSRETSIPVHLALYFSLDPGEEWTHFTEYVRRTSVSPASVSILTLEAPVTTASILSFLLPKIKSIFPGIPVGFGSPFYFTELNRNRLQKWEGLDFVVFSNSPQVHAFDTTSMVETFEGQEATVETARQFLPSLPVHVSPVSLFPRFNPNATAGVSGKLQHVNPPDERQYSLFVAGWTLGCLSALARQKVSLIDFYEVAGSRGLCNATAVSPTFLILRWLQMQAGRRYFPVGSRERDISALGMDCSTCRFVLVANHSWREKEVSIPGFNLTLQWRVDGSNVQTQVQAGEMKSKDSTVDNRKIILNPFSIVALRLDEMN